MSLQLATRSLTIRNKSVKDELTENTVAIILNRHSNGNMYSGIYVICFGFVEEKI
jgi:hypothetical protein